MTNQSPSNAGQNLEDVQTNSNEKNGKEEVEVLQEQQLDLKLEVEKLYGNVNQIKSLLQTVGSGLIIGILIAISISGWYAYRLLLQEQLSQQNVREAQAVEAELRELLEQLETRLQQHEAQLEQLNQELPDTFTSLGDLTEQTQENRRQLDRLRDRLNEFEDGQDSQPSDEDDQDSQSSDNE
ncbi:MAG: hypothetical protein F6K30_06025 [Cyanothece sp. SIO2G6]|nr:hypothetical protein [Cyanothece sp. SIO2G6]